MHLNFIIDMGKKSKKTTSLGRSDKRTHILVLLLGFGLWNEYNQRSYHLIHIAYRTAGFFALEEIVGLSSLSTLFNKW